MSKSINYNLRRLAFPLIGFSIINLSFMFSSIKTMFAQQTTDCVRQRVLMGDEDMIAGVLMSFDNHLHKIGTRLNDLLLRHNNLTSKSSFWVEKTC